MDEPLVRRLGKQLEVCHAVVYFAPEASSAYEAVGCRGYWMGYFGSRAGALGPAPAEVVAATFFGFAPALVGRAVPDVWARADPHTLLTTRRAVADAGLRRLLGDRVDSPEVAEAAALAGGVLPDLPRSGRPLFAAHAALPPPHPPHLALWHAATCWREFRGDGHIAALLCAGLDGVTANVLAAACGLVDPAQQPRVRGWDAERWQLGVRRLAERGLVGADGTATAAGRDLRAGIEDRTDEAAAPLLAALGPADAARLSGLLRPLVAAILASGALPFPNPIGLSAPD